MEDYDVIVVGAGFAGVSAALFTGAWRLKTLVLEAEKPPQLWSYPRRSFLWTLSGSELIQNMVEEAKRHGVEIHVRERVTDLEIREKKIVKTLEKEYSCDALIITTGPRCKFLNVPGESWLGRGVSYCAVCDGMFFKDGQVVVVGSENEAVQEALVLTQIARNITLVTNSEKLKAESSLVGELKRKGAQIIEGCKIEAIERGEFFNNVIISDVKTGEKKSLQADGIFISLGREPSALNVEKIGVKTHRQGGIIVDSRQQTNVEGVFAAGDCTCGGGFNLTSCIGDGVKAGLAAYLYIKRLKRTKA
ncbi:MAG: FAD-dependent oxidoreductase [Candidatus Bathyarchaeota archaeon]|nr:FAD-dependent oxidoreductase [Candidatus Bathyarchaeota archaeon]